MLVFFFFFFLSVQSQSAIAQPYGVLIAPCADIPETGRECILWTLGLPRPGMKIGISVPPWIRIKFLNNTNAYLKLAKFNSNSIGPKFRVDLG